MSDKVAEKQAMEELKETVAKLTTVVGDQLKSIGEKQSATDQLLAELKEKQDKYEAKRKGMFAGAEDDVDRIKFQMKRAPTSLDKLLEVRTTDESIAEFQKANDEILMVSQILGCDPRETKLYRDVVESNPMLMKAMDSATASEGLEWVPSNYSARLFDRVRLELKVAALHESVQMPTAVYKLPVVASDSTGYLVSEQTTDDATLTAGNRITASKPGTGNVTLTAKKIGGRTWFSEELNEDSIVPVLPLVTNNIVIAISTAIEDAVINGDTSGTHQDSDVTAASDARKAWAGYRFNAQSGSKTDISTFTGNNIMVVRKKMGKYGIMPSQLALITSISGYTQMLNLLDAQNNQLVTTLDKYGPSATILTGELGKIYGIPIIVSEKVRENLNATGVYDGTTTTKTEIIIVHRPSFILGDRRAMRVKSAEDIHTDQTVLVATTRRAFAPVHAVATNYIVGVGYNITS